jgi:Tol biopolymer transport system component
MRGKLLTAYCSLLTAFLFLLSSCTPTPQPPLTTSILFYRFDHSAFVQYSADLQPIKEIPFSIPLSCGLDNAFSAPVGKYLLIELNCPNGQTVLFLDSGSGSATQPVTDSDAHFLAWTSDGKAAYLRVDSLGRPEIIRVYPDGKRDSLSASEYTYDLSAQPASQSFTFTFSRGLGYGSEMHLANARGQDMQQLYSDPYNYLSFARWSPNGSQIAFIKTPDSQTPFMVGELWVMDADGSNPHKLADVDTGHGYAANWSPDGMRLAFVKRENTEDENANQTSDALISNIYVVDIQSGEITPVTYFTSGRAETPLWSPNGNTLVFSVVLNGRMDVQIADMLTGEIRPLITEPACCAAWMRK